MSKIQFEEVPCPGMERWQTVLKFRQNFGIHHLQFLIFDLAVAVFSPVIFSSESIRRFHEFFLIGILKLFATSPFRDRELLQI
jgi:hypothetical protein